MQKMVLGHALRFERSFTRDLETTMTPSTVKNHIAVETADSSDNPNAKLSILFNESKIEKRTEEK